MINICPICDSQSIQSVAEFQNAFFANSSEKLNLTVSYCNDCQYCFQSSAYSESYDQIAANVYRNYLVNNVFPFPERTSKNLIALECIEKSVVMQNVESVLEIGSNRGDLLFLIKEK